MLAQGIDKQLARAFHVVIDLGEVAAVDPRGLALLVPLGDKATATGTQIHLVRVERDDVRAALRITGLDQLFSIDSTAEWVIAEVVAERHAAAVVA
jgi:anti-anti-sigma factor